MNALGRARTLLGTMGGKGKREACSRRRLDIQQLQEGPHWPASRLPGKEVKNLGTKGQRLCGVGVEGGRSQQPSAQEARTRMGCLQLRCKKDSGNQLSPPLRSLNLIKRDA